VAQLLFSFVLRINIEKIQNTSTNSSLEESNEPLLSDGAEEKIITIRESLKIFKHFYFYVLMLSYFSGIFTGIFIITHSANIWKIYNKNPENSSWDKYISLTFSIVNCTTTLVVGWTSDFFQRKYRFSRSKYLCLIFASVSMILFILATLGFRSEGTQNINGLYILLLILVAIEFGSCFALFPAITGDIYGAANFGKYFGFLQFGSASAAILAPITAAAYQTNTGDYNGFCIICGSLLFISALTLLIKPKPFEENKTINRF